MKFLARLLTLCLAVLASASFASIVPVGVQVNVNQNQVQNDWGWTECYNGGGNAQSNIAGVLTGCQGSYLMMAGHVAGSANYSILAAAARTDVLFNTGVQSGFGSDVTHTANGAEWYFSDSWSWGFSALGNAVELTSCDINLDPNWGGGGRSNIGMCWHTGSGKLDAGWGYDTGGSFQSIASNFHRVLLVSNGPATVPEPESLALVGLGLLAMATLRRKSQKKS